MTQDLSAGAKLLNSFLRLMVFSLVLILIAIPLCILLDKLGLFEALGWFQ